MPRHNPHFFSKVITSLLLVLVALGVSIFAIPGDSSVVGKAFADATGICATQNLSTAQGKSSQTITVSSTGTYRVWSRIMASSSSANSYFFQVDDGCAYSVGGSAQIPANVWTWVNYQDGNTASTIDVTLTAGVHTLNYVGKQNVQLDKVMVLASTSCVPTGLGDNCQVTDITAPVTSITSPTEGSTIHGQVAVTASAYDLSQIGKVELYVDGTLVSTVGVNDIYTFDWNTTALTNGNHTLQVKAYDTADPSNIGTSTTVTVKVNNPPAVGQLDVNSSIVLDNTTVSVGDTISATAKYKNTSEFPVTVNDIVLSARTPDGQNTVQQHYFTSTDHGPYTVAPGDTVVIGGSHTVAASEPVGSYWAYASYVDTAGVLHRDATESSFTVTAPDTTAPTVAVTQPTTSVTVHKGEVVETKADVADNVGITKVEAYVNGSLQPVQLSSPYHYDFDTSDVNLAEYAVTFKAYDAAGNTTVSSPQMVTVVPPPDVTKPTVSLTKPTLDVDVRVGDVTTISATASDNVAVSSVEIYVDGTLQATLTDAPYNYDWDTTDIALGTHSITAKAFDAAGNTKTSIARPVKLVPPPDTTKPTLALSSPAHDSSVIVGDDVAITTDASDNVAVTKVEFYVDGLPRLETDTAPYTLVWNTIGADIGPHAIMIKAYDEAGNVGELSANINIEPVPDTTAPTVSMTAPDANASSIVGTPLPISADATDNDVVNKVEIAVDGDLKATLTDSPYTYSWDTADATIGEHTLSVKAYDPAGNSKEVSRTTAVKPVPDTAKPTVSIVDPDEGIRIVTGTNSLVKIDADDNFGVTKVELSIDGTTVSTLTDAPYTYDWDTTGLGLGDHTLSAQASDAAGNVGQSSVVNFVIVPPPDLTAPNVTITAPADAADVIIGTDIPITANASDNKAVAKVEFFVDGIPRSETTTAPYALTWGTAGADLGVHTIMVRATDAAGNASEATTTLTIVPVPDTTKPNIAIASPAADTHIVTGDSSLISLDASDDFGVTEVKVSIDGTVIATLTDAPYSYQWDTTGADLGDHVITASASDAAGNVGQATAVTVTVVPPPDVTAPTVGFATPSNGAQIIPGNDVTITANASDNVGVAKVEFFIDDSPRSEMQADPYTLVWNTVGADLGAHTLRVRASDAAGNSSESTITVTIIDVTKPTVSITSPDSGTSLVIGATAPIALAAADNVGVAKVEVSVDGAVKAALGAAPYAYNWDTTGSSLGNHTLTAKAYDAAGNIGDSSSVTLHIVPPPDTTKPVVSINAPAANANIPLGDDAVINATATDNMGVTKTEFFIDGTSRSVATDAPYGYTWKTATANLGTHTILVRSSDAAGNTSDATATVNIVDASAPTAELTKPTTGASIIVGTLTDINATATDNIGVAKVDFIVDGTLKFSDTASPYTYNWDTTGLALGAHTLAIKSYDAAANTKEAAASVTILPVPDTTKPTTAISSPANGANIVTGTTTAVAIAAGDDTAVTKVEVLVDNALKTTLNTAPYNYSWNTTGLSLGSHTIATKAYDAAGNVGQSTAVTVNIVAPPDLTKPATTITSPTAGANIAQGNTVSIAATATDNIGVTKVEFFIDGSPRSEMQSGPYSLAWNTVGTALGAHSITARATDGAGNFTDAVVSINIVTPPDTTVPTVALTAPAANTQIVTTTTVPITATASDNVAVTKVELYVDGVLKASPTATPYTYSWNTTGVSIAAHTITAKAYDAAGNVTTTSGTPVTIYDPGGNGLAVTYFNNTDFTGTTFSRTETTVNTDWGTGSPNAAIDPDTFSARWTGFVKPTTTETYTFLTQTDEGIRLWVNGVLVIDNWTAHTSTLNRGTINLTAGVKYSFKMEYYENTGAALAKLFWSTPTIPQGIIPRPVLYQN